MSERKVVYDDYLVSKRHLPHIQSGGRSYFVTYRSVIPELPPPCRQLALDAISFWAGKRYYLEIAVAMPDHCHILLCPMLKDEQAFEDLGSILHSVKSYSAGQINKSLSRQKMRYIWRNPVRARLVDHPSEYPFFAYGDHVRDW